MTNNEGELPDRYLNALESFARELEGYNWAVSGSLNRYFHGGELDGEDDIDIFATEEATRQFEEQYSENVSTGYHSVEKWLDGSAWNFSRVELEVEDVEVEVIADFQVDEQNLYNFEDFNPEYTDVNEVSVPLIPAYVEEDANRGVREEIAKKWEVLG